MKLLIVLLATVATVSSAPQGPTLDTQDAEFVPSVISRGSSSKDTPFPPEDVGIRVFRIPQFSILDLLGNDRDSIPRTRNTDQDYIFTRLFGGSSFPFPRFSSFFPIFSHFPGPSDFPDFPNFTNLTSLGDFPNGYKNTTHEVKLINGSRVEVNKTITKTDDNGIIFTRVIINVAPEEDDGSSITSSSQVPPQTTIATGTTTAQTSTISEEDPRNNQVQTEPYEDFGVSPQ